MKISTLKLPFFLSLLSIINLINTGVALAQRITPAQDGTGTLVIQKGNTSNITGGQLSNDQKNLFQSFQQFGLNTGEIANFLSNPNIRNILGRVTGGNPSVINGLIQVTGGNSNLYLMNPAGIIFGNNASLNVPAAFTATTATSIGFGNNFWFKAVGNNNYASLVGTPINFNFSTAVPGSIINTGDLAVGNGQSLTLLGGTVVNNGTISAPGGNITIASVPGQNMVRINQVGNVLSLDLTTSAENGDKLPFTPLNLPAMLTGSKGVVNGLTMNSQGKLVLADSNSVVADNPGSTTISGQLNVSGVTGGSVNLLGSQVSLVSANINASGSNGGGTVLIGGGLHGQGTVPNAQTTTIDQNSVINANAIKAGNGGQVVVWSDGETDFAGTITATGGSDSGDGGFVETSGKGLLHIVDTALVNTSATTGQGGTWLLDPTDITVTASTSNDVVPPVNSGSSTITSTQINNNLSSNTNLDLDASNFITVNDGGIIVPSSKTLTLSAPTVNLNDPITVNGTLTGTATTVNVGAAGSVQNGVDASATGGKVNLAATTYTLGRTVNIVKSLSIQGTGASTTQVDGNHAVQVFNISGSGTVASIDGLTIENGNTTGYGGGIAVGSGSTLNLSNSTLSANSAYDGGGIYNNLNGTATISNSTLSANSANSTNGAYGDGGGILNAGTATISNSTLSGNSAGYIGGGILNDGTETISNSTLSANSANVGGGGIFNGGTETISNSTLSANSANVGGGIFNDGTETISNSTLSANSAAHGGGIYNNNGTATISNSTLSANSANVGGGIYNISGTAKISNSIVAGNTLSSSSAESDAFGITSTGYNLVGQNGNAGGFTTTNTDIILPGTISTAIAPLANNGGTTQTQALVAGSPAIDASDPNSTLTIDQRGAQRGSSTNGGLNAGTRIDIGAYEASSSYLVTNTDDSSSPSLGSLRAAINFTNSGLNVNNNPSNNPVATQAIRFDTAGVFATPQTITLQGGELGITNSVNIQGTGSNNLSINGNQLSRVFDISNTVTVAGIDGLTIENGHTTGYGGGIAVGSGSTLNLSNSTLSANSAYDGGGIYNNLNGTATISNSTLSANSANSTNGAYGDGGGILNAGTATISNSTLSGNSAAYGGGISNDGTETISNSTLSANSASYVGGGIVNTGTATISNSTLSANSAAYGGGIVNTGTETISNSTLSANSAGDDGGGIYNISGTAKISNSIVAGNTLSSSSAESDAFGITSAGYNLVGQNGNAGGFTTTSTDIILPGTISTAIAPLGNYGGLTETQALLPGSPAIDAGNNSNVPTTDQRGNARIINGTIDIGAFESQGFVLSTTSGTPQSTTVNTAFSSPLVVSVTSNDPNAPVNGGVITFTAPQNNVTGLFSSMYSATAMIVNGTATSPTITANTKAGIYNVTATATGVINPANFSLTNNPDVPASIIATGGTPQSTTVNTAFANDLQVKVTDQYGNLIPNSTITFTAPTNGASGEFMGNVNTITATTNSSGVAQVPITANTIAGNFTAIGQVGNLNPANFSLTNNPDVPASITATGGTPQSTTVNTAFANDLQVKVTDQYGNLIPNSTITFTAPTNGASGEFMGNVNTITATTNSSGVAQVPITANTIAGNFTAIGQLGSLNPANFSLTNNPDISASASVTATDGTSFLPAPSEQEPSRRELGKLPATSVSEPVISFLPDDAFLVLFQRLVPQILDYIHHSGGSLSLNLNQFGQNGDIDFLQNVHNQELVKTYLPQSLTKLIGSECTHLVNLSFVQQHSQLTLIIKVDKSPHPEAANFCRKIPLR